MNYLESFLLKKGKNSPDAYSQEPLKPPKPVLEVLAVPQPRHVGEILPSGERSEVLDDAQEYDSDPWLCPHCGQEAVIDDVFPSLDGERTLTMWSCEPCGVVAVTPDAIKEPPPNWVKRTEQ